MAENAKMREEARSWNWTTRRHFLYRGTLCDVERRGEEEEEERRSKRRSIYVIIITMVYNVDLDLCVCVVPVDLIVSGYRSSLAATSAFLSAISGHTASANALLVSAKIFLALSGIPGALSDR